MFEIFVNIMPNVQISDNFMLKISVDPRPQVELVYGNLLDPCTTTVST